MKVVAFNGSPNRDGNTFSMLNRVADVLRGEGVETDIVQVGGHLLHGCTACYRCGQNRDGRCAIDGDAMNEWIARMVEADGMLLGSPTYFADVSTEMKALIDRAGFVSRSNGSLFRRKVGAAVIAVRRAGEIHAFDTINHFFLINQMIVPGSSYWNMAIGRRKGEVSGDEEGMQTMDALGENMAWLLKRLTGAR